MANLESLLRKCKLKDQDLEKQITEKHRDKISRTCCTKWKCLPPYLGIEPIVKHDIDCDSSEEVVKRSKFLSQWNEKKGSDATYKKLIHALIEIDCVADAERVCELLLLDSQPQQVELNIQATGITTGMCIIGCMQ